jgi:guanylate kinase
MAGKALIFSAPSGSGKTTIVQRLLRDNPDLGFSISASTRGMDYYFLTSDEFRKKIDNNEFLEWEEVYDGNYYGTLKSEIDRLWKEGKDIVFDVDVYGGLNLKKYFGNKALAVFVKVPSLEVLRQRLTSRGTESEEALSRRLYKAQFETTFQDKFDRVLLNDDIDRAVAKAQKWYEEFKS